MKNRTSFQTSVVKKKNFSLKRLIISAVIVVVTISALVIGIQFALKTYNSLPTLSKVYSAWDSENYELAAEIADRILVNSPSDGTAWAYKGYALFYMAMKDSDTSVARENLDSSINALRMAVLYAPESLLPQIQYILGKAYFHKNSLSSYHYYADLAVYYLSEAEKGGIESDDIPEYLGLSYAQLNMPAESIKAFTEALFIHGTDVLRFAIAEQYIKDNQPDKATQYLFNIKNNTADETLKLKACRLLAEIYTDAGEYTDAESEYRFILEINPNDADAYYGIGVLYEKQGRMAEARAEWRKALKIQGNHKGALEKLG